MIKVILSETSWLYLGTLPSALTNYDFETLYALHPSEYGLVKMYDKVIQTPRWTACYIQPYRFSGLLHPAKPLHQSFQPFLEWANTIPETCGGFNQVLVNFYENGHHYIGPHTDNESQLIQKSPIMSISLGETRTFRLRNAQTKSIVKDIEMHNNSFIIMCGNIQREFTHEVPKVAGKKGQLLGRRINLTMRQFHIN